MKKINLFLFLFITSIASAQFTVEDYNGVPILDGDIRGFNSIEPTGEPGANESVLYFWINNPSTTDEIYMKIQLESITNADGSDYQFCFGDLCIFDVHEGTVYPTSGDPEVIAPGGTNFPDNKFQNDDLGDGTYPMDFVWKFFQVDDNDNEIGTPLRFTYRFDPNLSVDELENTLGVTLENTLVFETLNVQSQNNLDFEIFNLNGQMIQTNQIAPGHTNINVENLQEGMYFIKFANSSGQTSTSKFIVK